MGPEPTYPQGIDAAPPTWVWAVALLIIAVNCGLGLLLLVTAAQQAVRRRRAERAIARFVAGGVAEHPEVRTS